MIFGADQKDRSLWKRECSKRLIVAPEEHCLTREKRLRRKIRFRLRGRRLKEMEGKRECPTSQTPSRISTTFGRSYFWDCFSG